MLRFGETKVANEEINIWDVNIDNLVLSKLVETNQNFKHLIRYLDEVIRQLILIFS